MEKLILSIRQTEALNKVSKNLKVDTAKESDATMWSHLEYATDYCENIEENLNAITEAIDRAKYEFSNRYYGELPKHLVETPELFHKLKRLIKDAEDELARAVKEFENAAQKTNISFLFPDEKLKEIIEEYEAEYDNYDYEFRNGDIYIIFTNYDFDEDENYEICIATNAEYEHEEKLVEDYINELLSSR